MGISKYAKATYGYKVPWNLIETVTKTEIPSCGHIETIQEVITNGIRDLAYCPVCGSRVGYKPKWDYSYTDLVEEVPEDKIDGYYVTCKGYPVYKKEKEYQNEEDFAYIGFTIGEDDSLDITEPFAEMILALGQIFPPESLGIHCWVDYA